MLLFLSREDYWTIGGVTYRIAAFDYYYRAGDTDCQTHHVTLVPDASMYTHVMNDTNVTTGAYVGSKMYKEGLTQAKNTINAAFGTSHILNHRQYLQNAVTDNYASGGSWYDSTVELMTEQNVYGCKIFGNVSNGTALPNNYTVDKSQYPLFKFRPDMISNRNWYWLRDVVSAADFAYVGGSGDAVSAFAFVRKEDGRSAVLVRYLRVHLYERSSRKEDGAIPVPLRKQPNSHL